MVGPKTFVTCPHCAKGVTVFTSTMQTGSGSLPTQCPQCHKSFRLYVTNGNLTEVR